MSELVHVTVDDREVDVPKGTGLVEAAQAAGIPAVAVSYGYAHRAPHELGADAVIDTFPALPAALGAVPAAPRAAIPSGS